MSRAYAFRNGWRWVGWFLRRGKIVAAIREAWDAYVRGHDGETCQECGRPYLFWHARDDLYGQVTGRWPIPWSDGSGRSEAATGQFCPACFTRMAKAKGLTIIWQPELYPGTGHTPQPASSRTGREPSAT
jgi:hypothetical protein